MRLETLLQFIAPCGNLLHHACSVIVQYPLAFNHVIPPFCNPRLDFGHDMSRESVLELCPSLLQLLDVRTEASILQVRLAPSLGLHPPDARHPRPLLHAVLRFDVLLVGFVPVLLLDVLACCHASSSTWHRDFSPSCSGSCMRASVSATAAHLSIHAFWRTSSSSGSTAACNLILPSMPAAKAPFQRSWSVDLRDPSRLTTLSRCADLSALE